MTFRFLIPLALCGSVALATSPETLVVQLPAAITSVEPAQAIAGYDPLPVLQIYESLLLNDFGEYTPLLATEYTQSPDGLVYTFTLREGVTFHDGSSLTCADAEYSLRRTLMVGNEVSQAAQVRANLLGVPGFTPEVLETFTFERLAETVRCNEAGQLVLSLERNLPTVLEALTQVYIVPQAALAAGGDWSGTAEDFADFLGRDVSDSLLARQPLGTGAYRFRTRDATLFVLEAFDGYWGGPPPLTNVVVQFVANDTARVLALQQGDADIAVLPDRGTLARVAGSPGVRVYEELPVRDVSVDMMFNLEIKDPAVLPAGELAEAGVPTDFFADPGVRAAFAAAFDMETYLADALGGLGTVMNTPLPPNSWANDPSLERPAYDLEVAEAEFKRAFGGRLWETGFTLPVVFVAGSGLSQVSAEILRQNIERLNPRFHLEIRTVELSAGNAALLGGQLAVSVLNWGGADPDTVLRGLYSSEGVLSSALSIRDPELERLLDAASEAVGRAARRPLYAELLRYLDEQTYGVPLAVPSAFAATSDALQGYEAYHRTNLFRLLSK